jgi:hypothetical protein
MTDWQPIATAPRDGRWLRLHNRRYGMTTPPVRWCASGRRGAGWYTARGHRFAPHAWDCWGPAKAAPPAWCAVLGLTPTASREEIVAAYRERAKAAHPDVGGSTLAMQALTRARDAALAARGSA